jgi:hypothetical protein
MPPRTAAGTPEPCGTRPPPIGRACTWARCVPARPSAGPPERRGQSERSGARRVGAPPRGDAGASGRVGVPPHGGRGRAVAHQTPRRAARWRKRAARQGRPAGEEPGTCPAPRAGEFNVARTCVLIKTASHLTRTCVLITCMSQARYGPWPRSDVIPWCRQNGGDGLSGTVAHPVTCRDRLGGAAALRPGGGEARHPGAGRVRRSRGEALLHPSGGALRSPSGGALRYSSVGASRCRCGARTGPADSIRSGRLCGRARQGARAGAAVAEPRLSRSLLPPQSRKRTAADGGARPRLTNARAPC